MTNTETISKIAVLPKILEAAQLLYSLKLIHKTPTTYVRMYVQDNPDINQLLSKKEVWK